MPRERRTHVPRLRKRLDVGVLASSVTRRSAIVPRMRILTSLVFFGMVAGCLKPQSSEPPQASSGATASQADHGNAQVAKPEVKTKSQPIPGFMRGINFGNALDAPKEGAWGVTLSERHFQMAAEAGLDHVRLPVKFSAHAGEQAPFTVEPAFFERVDWAINQALAHHLSIILDLHHYEEIMKEPDRHAERLIGIWKQISARYKDRPATVAFELLNEPSDKLDADRLNAITARGIQTIRADNPKRLVIVDSYFWAADDQLKRLVLPEDDNVIASFHMYQPILFTHQGAAWMGPEYQTRDVVFPGPPAKPVKPVAATQKTPWVKDWFDGYNAAPVASNPGGPSTIFTHFKTVEDYIADTKRRVYMGEFAAIDNADPKSRENWVRIVREEAERRNIGWAYWDDGGGNKAMLVANSSWVPYLRSALLDR